MRALLVPALALATAGCVSSGDITLLHREITDVSRQVEQLSKQSSGKQDLDQMSRRLADQSAQILKSNADIQVEINRLRDAIETLQANLEATNQRLEALTNEMAAARERVGAGTATVPATGETTPEGAAASGTAAGGTTPTGVMSEPAQLYRSAYEDYLRGNFDMAVQGFKEYQSRYPDTDLADNALYWIGECYYAKQQYKDAIDAFTTLLNTYKTSDKAAAALLKKGFAYLELGDRAQAVINLQYVLYEYPGSKEADLARERLSSLGVKVR